MNVLPQTAELEKLEPVKDYKQRLQELSPRHKEALSLIAQGVKRGEVASICGFTPEYVTWVVRQEICKEYLQEIQDVVDFRLSAMTSESVDTIQDVMKVGTSDERLKAAKLQLETVGRVGSGRNNAPVANVAPDHFSQLADRLVSLLESTREGKTYESHQTLEAEVSEGEFISVPSPSSQDSHTANQP